MIVAGLMSGTSADGVDVALVRIRAGSPAPALRLLAHQSFPYPPALRAAVLEAMNAARTSTAELARLNWRLGLAYAEAYSATLGRHPVRVALVGCHGQTLYHQASAGTYLGRRFACTWQAGETAALARAAGVPVVSNFRPADMVAGGQGAPLVPLLDYVYFVHPRRARVLQNIGGIANLTAIPAGAQIGQVSAFDSGPGNMVIDALAEELLGRPYDRNGAAAARGKVLEPALAAALEDAYFRAVPPKAAGREQYGREYARRLLARCRRLSPRAEDALATATALTAASIGAAFARFVRPRLGEAAVDYIVSGGGARNRTLMRMLAAEPALAGARIRGSDDFGLPAEAKEAAAFALLAWQSWQGSPGNVPAATGAAEFAVLGQITAGQTGGRGDAAATGTNAPKTAGRGVRRGEPARRKTRRKTSSNNAGATTAGPGRHG